MINISRFIYEAYDSDKTLQRGELDAENSIAASVLLRRQGLVAVDIKEVKENFAETIFEYIERLKVGDKWLALFFRQLSTTLDVMNLKEVLELFVVSAKNQHQAKILKAMLHDIEIGKSLAESMANYKSIFSNNIIQLVVIGQRSGRLQEISARLAEQLEREYKSRKKLKSAMYYPAFVFFAAIISIAILISVVLPVFAGFFESQGASLPLLTRIILTGGVFLSEHILLIMLALTLSAMGFIWCYRHSDKLQLFLDKMILKLPFIGQLIRQKEFMNIFGSLSFLLESGVLIDEAVKMVSTATTNHHIQSHLQALSNEIAKGGRFYSEIFPIESQGLITTGESSGTLPEMLQRCEKLCEFEVEELSSQMPVKVEIAGTLIVGMIVAAIVFAVMLPILSINI